MSVLPPHTSPRSWNSLLFVIQFLSLYVLNLQINADFHALISSLAKSVVWPHYNCTSVNPWTTCLFLVTKLASGTFQYFPWVQTLFKLEFSCLISEKSFQQSSKLQWRISAVECDLEIFERPNQAFRMVFKLMPAHEIKLCWPQIWLGGGLFDRIFKDASSPKVAY